MLLGMRVAGSLGSYVFLDTVPYVVVYCRDNVALMEQCDEQRTAAAKWEAAAEQVKGWHVHGVAVCIRYDTAALADVQCSIDGYGC